MPSLYLVKPSSDPDDTAAKAVELSKDFCFQCGFRALPYLAEEMTKYLLQGFDPAMIREAIARTARAPRPSFAYLAAIMRNAAAAGQYDYPSFAAAYHAWHQSSSSQAYKQREYTEEDLLSVSEDLISLARQQRSGEKQAQEAK